VTIAGEHDTLASTLPPKTEVML